MVAALGDLLGEMEESEFESARVGKTELEVAGGAPWQAEDVPCCHMDGLLGKGLWEVDVGVWDVLQRRDRSQDRAWRWASALTLSILRLSIWMKVLVLDILRHLQVEQKAAYMSMAVVMTEAVVEGESAL